ncbi:hypothetical protein ERO13_D06G117266v2 [Gossypium hirsutum]|nr:hypothetical protein ERO13_D06G117266v2 [Gossypium hirsutum]
MACKISSLLTDVFMLSILFVIAGQAIAARDISKNDDQMKQPEFLKHDRSVLIPGLGRVGRHVGSTIGGNRQLPGGDDTFVPNPGFEVPIPAGRGAGIAGTNPRP